MKYWILESGKQGIFVGYDHGKYTGGWRPHFRWSIGRDDQDVHQFYSREAAELYLKKHSKDKWPSDITVVQCDSEVFARIRRVTGQ